MTRGQQAKLTKIQPFFLSFLSFHFLCRRGTWSSVTLANSTFIWWGWRHLCWVWCLNIIGRIKRVLSRWRISWRCRISRMSSGRYRWRIWSRWIHGCLPVRRLLKAIGARILSGGRHIARSSLSCRTYLTSIRSAYNLSGIVLSLDARIHYGSNQQCNADRQENWPNDSTIFQISLRLKPVFFTEVTPVIFRAPERFRQISNHSQDKTNEQKHNREENQSTFLAAFRAAALSWLSVCGVNNNSCRRSRILLMHITKVNGASRFQSDIGCVQPELFAFLYATTYRDAAVDAATSFAFSNSAVFF